MTDITGVEVRCPEVSRFALLYFKIDPDQAVDGVAQVFIDRELLDCIADTLGHWAK